MVVISIIRSKIYYVFVLLNDACQRVDWTHDDFLFVHSVLRNVHAIFSGREIFSFREVILHRSENNIRCTLREIMSSVHLQHYALMQQQSLAIEIEYTVNRLQHFSQRNDWKIFDTLLIDSCKTFHEKSVSPFIKRAVHRCPSLLIEEIGCNSRLTIAKTKKQHCKSRVGCNSSVLLTP